MKESDTPSVAPVPGAHTHTCLRCKQDFACLYPGVCMARRDVLPNLVVRLNNGGIKVIPHCVSPYKGYTAIVEYDRDSGVIFGTVRGIRDVVTFEADSEPEFEKAFHDSVDDYLTMCAERGEEPNEERISLREAVLGPEKAAVYAAALIPYAVAPVGGTSVDHEAATRIASATVNIPWEESETVTNEGALILARAYLALREQNEGLREEVRKGRFAADPAAALRSSPPAEPSDDFRLRPAYAHPINATEPSGITDTGEAPTLASLWGACPDITGGLSSEEFVGRQRASSEFLRQIATVPEFGEGDREYLRWIADYIERLRDALIPRRPTAPPTEPSGKASRRVVQDEHGGWWLWRGTASPDGEGVLWETEGVIEVFPAAPPTEVTDGGEFEDLLVSADIAHTEYGVWAGSLDASEEEVDAKYRAWRTARTALIEYEKRIRARSQEHLDAHSATFAALMEISEIVGMVDVDDYQEVVEKVRATVERLREDAARLDSLEAQAGDVDIEHGVGGWYLSGFGVDVPVCAPTLREAIDIFRKAADGEAENGA